MTTKTKTLWTCNNCSTTHPKWIGQCSQCAEWNSLEESIATKRSSYNTNPFSSKPIALDDVTLEETSRLLVGKKGWDRITGGGLVPGSLILIGGEPGIGKSTLLMQVVHQLSSQGKTVLYICGEESIQQTSIRARRLSISGSRILLLSETNLELIKQHITTINPDILVIDSIQIMFNPILGSTPGSISQVKEVTTELMHIAKQSQITTFIIGHITKSGELAGPKVLEHLVDTVLYFEGNTYKNYRMVRSIKNRFGPTNELIFFTMHDTGLLEIENPSSLFLQERSLETSGTAIIPIVEGSETLLVEIQALASPTPFSNPIRKTTGFDNNRFSLLLAVLEKRANIKMYNTDVFISIAGGLKISEPGADLGASLAIYSSLTGKKLPINCVSIGEIGLGGEIRSVIHIERRLKESIVMGFQQVIIPEKQKDNIPKSITNKLKIIGVKTITDAINLLR